MSTPTTQLEYASFPKRLAAFAFDYLVIAGYLILLTLLSLGVISGIGLPQQMVDALASPLLADGLTFLILVLPVCLYFTLQESSPRQATWGKRRLGLKVVMADGGRLSRSRAFMRSLLKLLPWQLAHTSIYHIPGWPLAPEAFPPFSAVGLTLVWVLAGAYVVSALVSQTHQTLYDWLSGAYVIVGTSTQ